VAEHGMAELRIQYVLRARNAMSRRHILSRNAVAFTATAQQKDENQSEGCQFVPVDIRKVSQTK